MNIGRAAVSLSPILMVGALSGCVLADPGTNGYANLRRDGTDLEVAVCIDVAVGSIYLNQQAPEDEDSTAFWKAQYPPRELSAGSTLSTDTTATPPVQGEFREKPRLDAGDTIFVALSESSDAIPDVTAQFTIPKQGLSDTQWLHEDGSLSEKACASEG
jgi:hypothetical protein